MSYNFVNNIERENGENILTTAKRRALYLLGRRSYSRGELVRKLNENYPEGICETCVDWVQECGYLNDSEYAENLAERLIRVKKYGLYKVRREMRLRFISEEIIEKTLLAYSSGDIQTVMGELVAKKFSNKLNDRKDAERVMQSLARRGFEWDDIKQCVSGFMENVELEYD